MQANETVAGAPVVSSGWRFKVGIALFALMILAWGLIPIEIALGMSAAAVSATVAGIAVVNKVIFLAAVTVMGKPGFLELKGRVFGYVKDLAPATTVSHTRYRIGLVLFCIPIVQGLLETWSTHIAPQLVGHQLWVDILMNGTFIVSLFVLGGNFWDKLRALFFADARAVFPLESSTAAAAQRVR
jgi:hypothetical protein